MIESLWIYIDVDYEQLIYLKKIAMNLMNLVEDNFIFLKKSSDLCLLLIMDSWYNFFWKKFAISLMYLMEDNLFF